MKADHPVFEIRGWDIERFDPDYVFDMIRRAHDAGMNTISFSHEIVMNAEEILWDWHRYQHLKRFCDACHDLGMQVYLWNHQINNPPERYIVPAGPESPRDRLMLDDQGLWDWLEDRYRRVLKRVPNFDGIILSLTESQFQVHRDNVTISDMPRHERMARLINAVHAGLSEAGKRVIVRDFLRTPEEMDAFTRALELVPDDVWVFTKCVPNDWQYCYPPHPLLGKVAPHRQIMELDCATEMGATVNMPFVAPEYYKRQLQIARDKGLAGAIARCDDGFHSNCGLPDEMNVYAYSVLLHDPDRDVDAIWSDWCRMRFGASGAELAERVLRRSFDMLTKIKYTLGFWTGHSAPSIEYTDGHLIHNSTAIWSDDPTHAETDRFLKQSGPETVKAVVAEKAEAQGLAEQSMADLFEGRDLLSDDDYRMLSGYHIRSRNGAIVGRLWARAYFALRWYRNTGSDDAKREIEAALAESREFIERAKSDPDLDALRLPCFVRDVEEALQGGH